MAKPKKTELELTAKVSGVGDQATAFKYKRQGQQLQRLREQHGLSGEELGKRVGVTRFGISGYETGRTVPSDKVRKALGQVLGVEQVASIGWPRSYAPTRYRRQSKLAPPDSPGAILKQLRLSLPDTPTQKEIAERLGMKEENYRWVESRGGRVTPELLEKLASIYSKEQLEKVTAISSDTILQ